MKIRKSKRISKRKGETFTAIIAFDFINYVIYVFPGTLSKFDILIKYKKGNNRIRTPKHIHWAIDLLIKKQSNKQLSQDFLKEMLKLWGKTTPLKRADYDTLKNLIESSNNRFDYTKYNSLNSSGEFEIEFLVVFMQLLMSQEKTNAKAAKKEAHMFPDLIKELLEENADIYKIVSTAGFRGRN